MATSSSEAIRKGVAKVANWFHRAKDDDLMLSEEAEVRKTIQDVRESYQKQLFSTDVSTQEMVSQELMEQFNSRAHSLFEYFKKKWLESSNNKSESGSHQNGHFSLESLSSALPIHTQSTTGSTVVLEPEIFPFSGKSYDWPCYMFLVTEKILKSSASNGVKYCQIYKSLNDEAKRLVSHIKPTDDDCVNKMLTILEHRYEVPSEISTTRILEVIDALPMVEKYNADDWNRLLDLAILVRFRNDGDQGGFLRKAIRSLSSKLPLDCRWSSLSISIDDMITHLKKEVGQSLVEKKGVAPSKTYSATLPLPTPLGPPTTGLIYPPPFVATSVNPNPSQSSKPNQIQMMSEFQWLLENKPCPVCWYTIGIARTHPVLFCRNIEEARSKVDDDSYEHRPSNSLMDGKKKSSASQQQSSTSQPSGQTPSQMRAKPTPSRLNC